MTKLTRIRALDGFSNVSAADVVSRSGAVQTHMFGNVNFPDPPVDLTVLNANTDRLTALIAESLDGSKKVLAERNKQRETVIHMLRMLARYAEVACQHDMAIFISSGFEPRSATRTWPTPLSENIRGIGHGANSGQLVIRLKAVADALCYELHYAATGDGLPGTWTTQLITRVKTPITISGLTPGTTYAFEVRSMGHHGFSDWSDSVTWMCT
jgi:hypothetical protein